MEKQLFKNVNKLHSELESMWEDISQKKVYYHDEIDQITRESNPQNAKIIVNEFTKMIESIDNIRRVTYELLFRYKNETRSNDRKSLRTT